MYYIDGKDLKAGDSLIGDASSGVFKRIFFSKEGV